MLALAALDNDPALWQAAGHTPVRFLQVTDLAAAAASSGNAPAYYARCILAYRAADRLDLLSDAGSGHIDLVTSLESFQSAQGYFSAVPASSATAGTETTAWAVLALVAAKTAGAPLTTAVAWLQAPPATDGSGGGPNADAGFAAQPTAQSSVAATSLAVQALIAAGLPVSTAVVTNAVTYLKTMQSTTGGFPGLAGGSPDVAATAWAMEGLVAAGVEPGTVVSAGHSPSAFLASSLQKDGSYGTAADAVATTAQAVIALAGRTLSVAPVSGKLTTGLDPQFGAIAPKSDARLVNTSLLVSVAYHDSPYGPGLAISGISVRLDGHDKTGAASIHATHLTLTLSRLKNGRHALVVSVPDLAGNVAVLHRWFTVAVPTAKATTHSSPSASPSPTPSSTATTGGHSASVSHNPPSTPSPTPVTTLTPTAVSPSPSATAPTPSPAAGRRPRHRKSAFRRAGAAAIMGASLAVLVPLGFVVPWLGRRRLMRVMEGATWGEILPANQRWWHGFFRHRRQFGDDEWS
jgi:hypothetical protein